MAFPMPLVIPGKTTNTLGGAGLRKPLGVEIHAQTKADLHSMLVGIASEDTAQQIKQNNPPQVVEVDNRTNKPLEQAVAKVVVLFGTVLAQAAMRMVETELTRAITSSTRTVTGRLSNVGSSWQWLFIPKGGAARPVSASNPPKTFARGDMLVLKPVNVPYATVVNRAVANSSRFRARAAGTRWNTPPKSMQNHGFLAMAARIVRRRSEFRQFRVFAEFSEAFPVPGELSRKQGTGVIVIRPRFKQVRV
jgi:hypothetical protein